MPRRVGKYTKYETSELLRMFDEGYSVYKICRTLNRSQKSIRNNLIRLGKIEGEITPRRTITKDEVMTMNPKYQEQNKFPSVKAPSWSSVFKSGTNVGGSSCPVTDASI